MGTPLHNIPNESRNGRRLSMKLIGFSGFNSDSRIVEEMKKGAATECRPYESD